MEITEKNHEWMMFEDEKTVNYIEITEIIFSQLVD